MSSQDLSQFNTLVNIMARLRASDGCPWDKKQTHASLQKFLLAECYEVLEAIDSGDSKELCEELGDLLMQIVFQAQVAHEASEFELEDVLRTIIAKLIYRHPHIFGSTRVSSAEEVAHNWEVLKKEEKGTETSILEGVPKGMPALAYSQEIQRRAAEVGFDWAKADEIIDKLAEEVGEFKRAESPAEKEREFGDVLFTLANIARRMDIDLEGALRRANERFYRRFTCMEELCRKRGLELSKLSLDEQNKLWEEAKRADN